MLSIVWLRRDLRLHDHAALAAALSHSLPVQPVFVFDRSILARFSNPNDRRVTFLAYALCALDGELRKRGGNLLLLYGDAEEIMPRLAAQWNAPIFAAEDYEPQTCARDARVAEKVSLSLVKDHLIFAPVEVLKDDATPFKIFTPYANRWRAKLSPSDYGEMTIHDKGRYAISPPLEGISCLSLEAGAEGVLRQIGYVSSDIALWPVCGAGKQLSMFVKGKLQHYADTRDMMGVEGTSRISPYLRFGLLSIREVLRLAMEQNGAGKWIAELIWREFYAMILWHYPESVYTEWKEKYRGLSWSRNAEHAAVWREGRTGFPVVDAAMRQLLQTGWMHNRARMIVASFATKDLQMDWRWGEEHFAQHLMDYELASNVGGWQWSASTGTDAQPWFRIFNPLLQSQKFDPQGDYIRQYVPELAHLGGSAIHDPSPLERGSYPPTIVDHAQARAKTLAMFKNLPFA